MSLACHRDAAAAAPVRAQRNESSSWYLRGWTRSARVTSTPMSMSFSERWRESALGSRVAAAESCSAVSWSGAELRAVGVASLDGVELVRAPPVLITTPLRAERVSAEVRRFGVSVRSAASSASPAALAWVGEASGDDDLDLVAEESEEDDGADSEVSTHATPQPKPVRTAAPTPKATASPPTRPTWVACAPNRTLSPPRRPTAAHRFDRHRVETCSRWPD